MLKNTLYVPDASIHLISVGKLGDAGFKTIFDAETCKIFHGSKIMAQCVRQGTSLY